MQSNNLFFTPVKGKEAFLPDWPNNPLSYDQAIAHDNATGAGVLLKQSRLCVLDIDHLEQATKSLKAQGIDLTELLQDSRAYQIQSPKDNKAKLVYQLPDGESLGYAGLMRKNDQDKYESILELRTGKGFQDVWHGSAYPGGGKYEHKGADTIPELPQDLLVMWKAQLEAQPHQTS